MTMYWSKGEAYGTGEEGSVWHWRETIRGRIHARSTKTDDKKLAEQIVAQWKAELLQQLVIKGSVPVPVHTAIKAFLSARKGTPGHGSATLHMSWWKKLPNIPLHEITLTQLHDIIEQREAAGTAYNTIGVTIMYWNAMINSATSRGWVTGVKLPARKPKRTRMRVLTEEEEVQLLAALSPDQRYNGKCVKNDIAMQANLDMVICLLHSGARLTEISHMTWDQVDLEKRTIYIKRKKNGNDTLLEMSDAMFAVLSRRKKTVLDRHVFPSKVNNSNSYKWLDKALERAGISDEGGKVTIHCFRHTYATRMLKDGCSLVEVQGLLGHKNLASTAIYLHVQKTAAASKAASVLNQRAAMRMAEVGA